MPQLSLSEKAPDFVLSDVNGRETRLSDFHDHYFVMALLRGFA